MSSRVSVVGLGKLGLPLAAVLAGAGFQVVGVDKSPDVLESVRRCEPLVYEPGLDNMLHSWKKHLQLSDRADLAVDQADVTIILVPTPSEDSGEFSVKYVLDVCMELGVGLRRKPGYHLVVVSSTVMPGHCDGPVRAMLEEVSGRQVGPQLGLCYSPEFVALGNVVHGMLNPEFCVIGESDKHAGEMLEGVYRQVFGASVPVMHMNLVNAEIMKVALNSYMVMKIAFANELAELCEYIPGANVDVVTEALALDGRISGKYFRGATAAAGECFPRDAQALASAFASQVGEGIFASAIAKANRRQQQRLVDFVAGYAGAGDVVGLLGLGFKVGTDVTTESAGMVLGERLDCSVVAYDPLAQVSYSVGTAQECVDRADIVVITLPDPMYQDVVFCEGQTVIDLWRLLDRQAVEAMGAEYVGVGLGPVV